MTRRQMLGKCGMGMGAMMLGAWGNGPSILESASIAPDSVGLVLARSVGKAFIFGPSSASTGSSGANSRRLPFERLGANEFTISLLNQDSFRLD